MLRLLFLVIIASIKSGTHRPGIREAFTRWLCMRMPEHRRKPSNEIPEYNSAKMMTVHAGPGAFGKRHDLLYVGYWLPLKRPVLARLTTLERRADLLNYRHLQQPEVLPPVHWRWRAV